MQKIRIATRKSPLAIYQSEQVKQALMRHYPQLEVELCRLNTEGDQRLDQSLAAIGGKGLFIESLEQAMLTAKADIAVHSVKDMPAVLPDAFAMSTVLRRQAVHDVLVSDRFASLADLPVSAIVGTASLRRQAQLKRLRPDIELKVLRGNVHTRLEKLRQQQYDAIILAEAGLQRLGLQQHIQQRFSLQQMLPAVGQGALCVEYCRHNQAVIDLLQPLQDIDTEQCVMAERQVTASLDVGCHAPVAAYAYIDQDKLFLQALVASVDGRRLLQSQSSGVIAAAVDFAKQVAENLLKQGAAILLKEATP